MENNLKWGKNKMKNKILKKKEKVMEESGRERGKDMATKKSKIKKNRREREWKL